MIYDNYQQGKMTEEAFNEVYAEFLNYYISIFPEVARDLYMALMLSLSTLIWPSKIVLFSLHNFLTGRDYTFSIDDMCDLGVAISVIIWYLTYVIWSNKEVPDAVFEAGYVTNSAEKYFYHMSDYDN